MKHSTKKISTKFITIVSLQSSAIKPCSSISLIIHRLMLLRNFQSYNRKRNFTTRYKLGIFDSRRRDLHNKQFTKSLTQYLMHFLFNFSSTFPMWHKIFTFTVMSPNFDEILLTHRLKAKMCDWYNNQTDWESLQQWVVNVRRLAFYINFSVARFLLFFHYHCCRSKEKFSIGRRQQKSLKYFYCLKF